MRTDFSKFDKPEERPKDARAIMAELRDLVLRVDFVSLVHPEAGSIKERMGSVTDDAERDTLKKRLARLKVTERQKYVVIVDELLRLAEANNYGLAKNGAFVYLYNGRYWEEIEKDLLTDYLGEIAERMGVKRYDARQFQVKENLMKQFLCSSFQSLPDPGDGIKINLMNGTYVIGEKIELREHRREDFLKYQLPFKYDPMAVCPLFHKYLNTVLPDKTAQDVMAEYLGYCFTRGLKLEKVLVLYGSGGNGKGVFFEIVCALLGNKNVSNYFLNLLCDDNGYYRAKLCNKIVNYSPEKGTDFGGEIFKSLCSGEPVPARLPYGEPFEITDYAKLILNANSLPVPQEQNEAYFRRFLIVPFSKTIPQEERDPDLPNKIIHNELSGIFNWVLKGLGRIITNRRFSNCVTANEALEAYKIESDSVTCFIKEEGYIPSLDYRTDLKTFYNDYRSFCMDNGYRPCSNRVFSKRVENNGITLARSHGSRYVYVDRKQEGMI